MHWTIQVKKPDRGLFRNSNWQSAAAFRSISLCRGGREAGRRGYPATAAVAQLERIRRTVRQTRKERMPIETDADRCSDAAPRNARIHGALSSRAQPSRPRQRIDRAAPRSTAKVRARRSPYSPRWNAELLRTSGGVNELEFVNNTGKGNGNADEVQVKWVLLSASLLIPKPS